MRIVDYPTAKRLQELGYDGERRYYWATLEGDGEDGANVQLLYQDDIFTPVKEIVCAPRLDDAAYFLRDEYDLHISIIFVPGDATSDSHYLGQIMYGKDYNLQAYEADNGLEGVLEKCVKTAIKIIQNKKP